MELLGGWSCGMELFGINWDKLFKSLFGTSQQVGCWGKIEQTGCFGQIYWEVRSLWS